MIKNILNFSKKQQVTLKNSRQQQAIQRNSFKFCSQQNDRGLNRQPYNLKEGDIVQNFKLLKVEELHDFQLKAYHLEHTNTNTKFLHIDAPDLNNCMAIIFKTIPNNDKGTPHILEHLACCGGEKYPVRDPFMKMLKRSLNTYMNAWTGPDFTAYPFSTQNKKDFKNLMSVYMDISMKALLKKTDFLQEGWRYDFNEEGRLEYKGVVFNEMKGVYQTPDSVMGELVNQNLYQNSIYSLMSGGNPPDITDLSYDEVLDFYKTHYHPSNAKIFSYGDLNFIEHLEYLDKNYLSQLEKQQPIPNVKLSDRLTEPKTDIVFQGPPETMSINPEAQNSLGFTFLCNEVLKDPIETLGLQVLSYLLFQQPNGPLYKALIEKGVAPAFIAGNGYENFSLEGTFTIGVNGIKEEDCSEVEKIIFDVLKNEVIFEEEVIESVIHMIEMDTKVPKQNFGLNILMQVLNAYNHGGNVVASLEVTQNLKILRQKIMEENFLQELTKKYLLENKHYLRYRMEPDEQYNVKIEEQEQNKLNQIEKKLSESQIEEIKAINNQLLAEQDAQEDDADKLPSLNINDIEIKVEETQFDEHLIDEDIPLYFTKQATNGVTFLRMKVNTGDVPEYYRQFLDIFTQILPQVGSEKYNKDKMSTLFNLYTSGFNVYFENSQISEECNNNMIFSISCIDRNIKKMVELFSEVICTPDFKDYEHLSTVIKNNATHAGQSIVDKSLGYALSVSQSSIQEQYEIMEKLRNTRFLCSVGKNMNKSKVSAKLYMEDIQYQLIYIMSWLIKRKKISFCVHSDNPKNLDSLKIQLEKFIEKSKILYRGFDTPDEEPFEPHPVFHPKFISTYYSLPMQINYVVQSLRIPYFIQQDTPQLHLLAELLSNKVLHKEIREKGGAYGGGTKIQDGVLSFYSYRDPNTFNTLNAFSRSIEEIAAGNFNEQDIKDAQMSVFQRIDKVITPQNKGLGLFVSGLTTQQRVQFRERLIHTDKNILKENALKYLMSAKESGQISQVIFGSDNAEQLEKFKESEDWTVEKAIQI